ncbi:MAG: GTP cyclohydrolase, FolE2/MptA family [Verrucomicrobiota bacterium]
MNERLENDPQSGAETRGVALGFVGIDRFELPFQIAGWDQSGGEQTVHAKVSLGVSTAAEKRGIHMSRLVEGLSSCRTSFSLETLPAFLDDVAENQNAERAEIEIDFAWFVERAAPVTGKRSQQAIRTTYFANWLRSSQSGSVGYKIHVPVTTLCPCSKEISDYGAHSQRGWIVASLKWPAQLQKTEDFLFPAEARAILETCGSAPIYPLLKRVDERHVTMQAYETPGFVEDLARQSALKLSGESRVQSFRIDIRNEESIHTHDAVARFEADWH